MKRFVVLALGIAACSIPLLSQSPQTARPSFEVAVIKPNASGDNRTMIQTQASGRFVATGVSLKFLMTFAYRVRDFQISGGPNWIASDRWDIDAKAEDGSIPRPSGPGDPNVPDPIALRVQSLIEDQFQLKLHRETKDLPVYELLVAKGGAKITPSADQTPFRPPERGAPPPPPPQPGGPIMPRGSMRMGRGSLEATAVSLSNFIVTLSQQLGRPVIDKTDLKGLFDIKLQWTPDPQGAGSAGAGNPDVAPAAADPSVPSIFTAVQEQLGLRLVSSKGPVDTIVIDSVQKPPQE